MLVPSLSKRRLPPAPTIIPRQEGGHQYHGAGAAVRNFASGGRTLAYVTPWHPRGYQLATLFRAKLTHVSPVWYQLRRGEAGEGSFQLVGGHEHDEGWLAGVRAPAAPTPAAAEGDPPAAGGGGSGGGECAAPPPATRVVPRVVVELSPEDAVALLLGGGPTTLSGLLATLAEERGYEGLVLEAYAGFAAFNGIRNDAFRDAFFGQVAALGAALRAQSPPRELFLAVPPLAPAGPKRLYLPPDHAAALAAACDGLSVMTYDHSSGEPGPNAPAPWLARNLAEAAAAGVPPSKLLIGANFYGYDFPAAGGAAAAAPGGAPPPRAVSAADVDAAVAASPTAPSWAWDGAAGEHALSYADAGGGRRVIWFPTPLSLHTKLEAVRAAAAGVAVWELGQGYECFMDLL